jgi:hypothetical protein
VKRLRVGTLVAHRALARHEDILEPALTIAPAGQRLRATSTSGGERGGRNSVPGAVTMTVMRGAAGDRGLVWFDGAWPRARPHARCDSFSAAGMHRSSGAPAPCPILLFVLGVLFSVALTTADRFSREVSYPAVGSLLVDASTSMVKASNPRMRAQGGRSSRAGRYFIRHG